MNMIFYMLYSKQGRTGQSGNQVMPEGPPLIFFL